MPPVNPSHPSVTRIFRWVRMLIDIGCHTASGGRNRAYFTPSRRSVRRMVGQEYRAPVASTSTRTSTPRRTASPSAWAKARPTSSRSKIYVTKETVRAGGLDRLQHGRIGFVAVDQRIDLIAPQQGAVYHAADDPGQHGEMSRRDPADGAATLPGSAFALRGLCPVSLEIPGAAGRPCGEFD